MQGTLDRAIRAARVAAAATLFAGAAAQANERALAERRAAFIEAYGNAETGVVLTDNDDVPALRDYVLYPYLRAARIAGRLREATGVATQADVLAGDFLLAHEGEPVTYSLRRAWLSSLSRREDWPTFAEVYDSRVTTLTMDCEYLSARILLGETRGLEAEIVERWLTPSQLPIECEPAFDWLRGEGELSAALIEERVRRLLENGEAAFARVIAGRLPDERARGLRRWARLIERPVDTLDALIADPDAGMPFEALLDGFSRLARASPAAAHARYGPLVTALELEPAQASALAVALALGLAWDRQARAAIEMFEAARDRDLDDYDLGWLARTSLWAGDWDRARAALESMSSGERDATAWTYWHGRTVEQAGEPDNAEQLYRRTFGDDNFYSALAAARLGERVTPQLERHERDARLVAELDRRAAFLRARELYYAGMSTEATREWRAALEGLTDSERGQSIHLAADWGWHETAVATATGEGVFYDYPLLYPTPFRAEIAHAARTTGIADALLSGLLRQESLFERGAVSSAGAIGLAQLSPDTARRTARLWQHPVPTFDDLFDPATNVLLGASELKRLIDELAQPMPVALAGYNAGPAAARRWLPDRPIEADVWIENIPYNETRAYVRRVLWHSLVYDWLETGAPQDASAWLTPIRPAAAP